MRALVLVLVLLAGGCSPSARQRVLSANASVLVETQPGREAFYARQHDTCLHEADIDAYRTCMDPPRALARAIDVYDRILRAAQAALDVSNRDAFETMIPDLIRAALEVVRGLDAAGVPVPDVVRQIAGLR